MNRLKITIVFFVFIILCSNFYGQTKINTFIVTKTGQGSQSIIFIPGFASSGDVWNERKSKYEKDYTCYTFTRAGFAGVKPKQD